MSSRVRSGKVLQRKLVELFDWSETVVVEERDLLQLALGHERRAAVLTNGKPPQFLNFRRGIRCESFFWGGDSVHDEVEGVS